MASKSEAEFGKLADEAGLPANIKKYFKVRGVNSIALFAAAGRTGGNRRGEKRDPIESLVWVGCLSLLLDVGGHVLRTRGSSLLRRFWYVLLVSGGLR